MKITCYPYQLEFKYPFRIAHGVRTHTSIVYVKIEYQNVVGWGEAALPPYLIDTQESVIKVCHDFAKRVASLDLENAFLLSEEVSSMPAKAALDMALWNIKAILSKRSFAELLGIESEDYPPKTYTISICDAQEMKERVKDGEINGFRLFKLKLDRKHDDQMLQDFKSISDKAFAVDVNQGWDNLEYAISFSQKLVDTGCVLIEQPFHKEDREFTRKLRETISIPIIADEACQTIQDLGSLENAFSGVNVKLQKCGGITAAYKMILLAREIKLKVLIGCMSESHIGCDAADSLSPLCDWCDLDGKFLIKNDEAISLLHFNS
jgi:L-alanine-DL-glutamate epimerase-like enolase superfamily enzyme